MTAIFGTPKLQIRSRFMASWLMIDEVKARKFYYECNTLFKRLVLRFEVEENPLDE